MQRSLRVRLLAGGACAIFVALAVAWAVMGVLFERHVQRQVEDDLIVRGMALISALGFTADRAVDASPLPADPRFAAPAGGLYWQVSGDGVLLRSRSLWDQTLASPAPARPDRWTTGDMGGPFDQTLVFAERTIQLDPQGAPLTVLLGADHARVTEARDAFRRDLGLFLAVLWIVLAAAAWVQVELGLKPLEDVRAALASLRKQASARLSERDYPAEAAPLANAINDLATAREQDLEQAQRRAADLAHSLKTPLAALAAQSRRAREAGAGDAADGLDRAIAAARRTVERELARTRAAASRGAASSNGRTVIAKLIQVIERTESGARIAFENDLLDAAYPVSDDVLMEMAGPLLENAAKFARARVRISGDATRLAIEDDGPGLSDTEAQAALARGKRLDESGGGHGLGLAIAHDLAQASGAHLHLGQSSLGGLSVQIQWREPT
ncbi:MAG: sensor histidine kinase [Hyphomonadaceae bacterium]